LGWYRYKTMNKKLVLFDIDGTIVSYKEKTFIPPLTLEAIDLLRQKGHIIAIASGRSLCTAKVIMNELNIHNAILHNGAQIIINNKSVFEKKINKDIATNFCRILSETKLCVFAFDGEKIYAHNMTDESKQFLEEQAELTNYIKPLKENTNSLFCINIYGEPSQIPINFADYNNLIFNDSLCELSVKGSSKGTALLTLSEELNVNIQDTIAVGDGLNDIDLLKASQIGIAVGNACDELKKIADIVTGDIEDGGIYEAFLALKLL